MAPTELQAGIEALVFCAQEPVTAKEIMKTLRQAAFPEVSLAQVQTHLDALVQQYQAPQYGFCLLAIAGGYQFKTKPAQLPLVEAMLGEQNRRKLSAAALETLAIAAYRQPVTRAELELIRGVSCDYTLAKLLERGLLEMTGRKDAPGRPTLYGTTQKFLEVMGLPSLRDLPPAPLIEIESVNQALAAAEDTPPPTPFT